jgi:hypothetical protein
MLPTRGREAGARTFPVFTFGRTSPAPTKGSSTRSCMRRCRDRRWARRLEQAARGEATRRRDRGLPAAGILSSRGGRTTFMPTRSRTLSSSRTRGSTRRSTRATTTRCRRRSRSPPTRSRTRSLLNVEGGSGESAGAPALEKTWEKETWRVYGPIRHRLLTGHVEPLAVCGPGPAAFWRRRGRASLWSASSGG